MPNKIAPSKSNFVNLTLSFQDADGAKPLAGFRVSVFDRRTNAAGDVIFRLFAAEEKLADLPILRITVLDLDGDTLLTKDIERRPDQAISPIKVKAASRREKLTAPLDKWRAALGHKSSPAVLEFWQKRKITSLSDVRAAAVDLSNITGLSAADKEEIALTKAHADLQLLSRDYKTNQTLINAGYRSSLGATRESFTKFKFKIKDSVTSHRELRMVHSADKAREKAVIAGSGLNITRLKQSSCNNSPELSSRV